jgi:YD repeat-containing protein
MMMAFDAANRLTVIEQGAGRTTVLFDNAGNQTEENLGGSRATYVWDQENRLVRVLNPDGTRSTYSYAGDGLRRTAQEAAASVTTFVWDGDDYLQERT